MHKFRRVGVIIDLARDNALLLRQAAHFVAKSNAKIFFICVVMSDRETAHQSNIQTQLENEVNFPYEFAFLIGRPVVEIVGYTNKEQLDLCLVLPEGNERHARFFYGSLVMSLLRKLPCPLWVMRQTAQDVYQRVCVAIDCESADADQALNERLIEIGTSYAMQNKAECYVITAWSVPGESMLRGPFLSVSDEDIERYADEFHVEVARRFEHIQQTMSDALVGSTCEIIKGYPGEAIPEYITSHHIDLLVMGTVARAGVKGLLIGNTAETVVNHVSCSLLTTKPAGFISPVL